MNLFWAIIFLAGGFILKFQLNKRQFNRRNSAGIEEFSSYGNAYTTRLMEKFGRLIAVILIILGVIIGITYFFGPTHK